LFLSSDNGVNQWGNEAGIYTSSREDEEREREREREREEERRHTNIDRRNSQEGRTLLLLLLKERRAG
jgi:hypothetical protein